MLWFWLRCKVNRPVWEYATPRHGRHDFADDDPTVHRICLSCGGFVVSNRHYNMFADL